LIATDARHPFFIATLRGAEIAARTHDYRMMLVDMGGGSNPNGWQNVVQQALSARALDGFIVFGHYEGVAEEIRALGGNAVLIDGKATDIPSIQLGFVRGMTEAVMHLLDRGHERIGYLSGDYHSDSFRIRRETVQRVLKERGIAFTAGCMESARYVLDDAVAAAHRLLSLSPPLTAILCDSDQLAAGVYKAARARALRIPEDLAVIGSGASDLSRILEPELTTLEIPGKTIGARGVETLVAWIEEHRIAQDDIVIPLKLVIRDSTAREVNS
jgi:DNA-binding LacI/PurR family transcriptional regulator